MTFISLSEEKQDDSHTSKKRQISSDNSDDDLNYFRRSIITILCYVYNCLGKYNETVKLAQSVLSEDLKITDRLNLLHYIM